MLLMHAPYYCRIAYQCRPCFTLWFFLVISILIFNIIFYTSFFGFYTSIYGYVCCIWFVYVYGDVSMWFWSLWVHWFTYSMPGMMKITICVGWLCCTGWHMLYMTAYALLAITILMKYILWHKFLSCSTIFVMHKCLKVKLYWLGTDV